MKDLSFKGYMRHADRLTLSESLLYQNEMIVNVGDYFDIIPDSIMVDDLYLNSGKKLKSYAIIKTANISHFLPEDVFLDTIEDKIMYINDALEVADKLKHRYNVDFYFDEKVGYLKTIE